MRCGLAKIYRMGWGDAVTDFKSSLSTIQTLEWCSGPWTADLPSSTRSRRPVSHNRGVAVPRCNRSSFNLSIQRKWRRRWKRSANRAGLSGLRIGSRFETSDKTSAAPKLNWLRIY